MYGTVATIKVKPGRDEELLALLDEWNRDYRPKVKGAMGGTVYRLDADPNTFIMTAVFQDKATYEANADSPEQDKWYQRLRSTLTADPDWHDGEIVQQI
jgi:quinol monooxygenase YgiN